MNLAPRSVSLWIALLVLAFAPLSIHAQSCQTSSDLEDAPRAAITAAGQRYFDMVAKGDVATLRQNAIPSLASDFSVIEGMVKDRQQDLAGAQGTAKGVFLLDGTTPVPHAEFFCGVFGKNGQTSNSAAFFLNNLPAGKYGVVLLDGTSAKGRTMVTLILQQAGTDWKLAGLFIKHAEVAGHNSDWFLARAREYKTKGQMHNAWLYYLVARNLMSPVNFMSTLATDKLYDEWQSQMPLDIPANEKTADLLAGTVTYKLTAMLPDAVGNDVYLMAKYQVADLSNTTQTYQANVAVMKALLAKFPEVKDAFAGVEARAVDPSGQDYGTLLAMKDIK